MITENLSTLKIHKLTQAQYDRELEAGNIDVNALYLTPDEEIDIEVDTTLTQEGLAADAKAVGDRLTTLETSIPSVEGLATEEYVRNKIAEAELGGEEVDLSGYAQKSELPTKVSQLENDKGYLTEHQDISGKLDASALPTAINTALAQAKESGEFDGEDGDDYVLTDADKQKIAEMAAELVDVPEGTSGDYIPVPATATVGQTIKASAVDDSGKPTAWEATDFPKWEKINEFSLTENALEVMIDADEDGNPFSLKKMMIAMDLPKLKNTSGEDVNTGYAAYRINKVDLGTQHPSVSWDDGKFVWELEAIGDYIELCCVKSNGWIFGNSSLNYLRTYKASSFDGTIHSFLWKIFSPNIDKPSAMAGALFEVWGIRA